MRPRTTVLTADLPLPPLQDHLRLGDARLLIGKPLRWCPPFHDHHRHFTLHGSYRYPPPPFRNPPSSQRRPTPPFPRRALHSYGLGARTTRRVGLLRYRPLLFPGLPVSYTGRVFRLRFFSTPSASFRGPALAAKAKLHATDDGTALLVH